LLSSPLSKKSINPRIARWSLELESCNYKIEHRPGESMPHIDALSRQTKLLSNKVEAVMEEPCVVSEWSKL